MPLCGWKNCMCRCDWCHRQNQQSTITTDCTFNVCSISKIYCTVCVMQLVDEGLIQLEDKVFDILPEFKMKDKRYKDITVRMCLDHSSGLPGTQWKHFSVSTTSKFDYYSEVLNYLQTAP